LEGAVGIVKYGLRYTRKPRALASQTGLRLRRTLVAEDVALRCVVAAKQQPHWAVHTAHQHPVSKQSVDLWEVRLEHCRKLLILFVLAEANGHQCRVGWTVGVELVNKCCHIFHRPWVSSLVEAEGDLHVEFRRRGRPGKDQDRRGFSGATGLPLGFSQSVVDPALTAEGV